MNNEITVLVETKTSTAYAIGEEKVRSGIEIGRNPASDICLKDPTVSGNQGTVVQGEYLSIVDNSNSNRTLVNGNPLNGDPYNLQYDDVITMGKSELIIKGQLENGSEDLESIAKKFDVNNVIVL